MPVRVDKKGPHTPLVKGRKCTTREIPLIEKEGQGRFGPRLFFLTSLA